MKKTFDFYENEDKYILKNTNPSEKREPFEIEMATMEFNSEKFYEYVFSDITEKFEIVVNHLIEKKNQEDSEGKEARRMFEIINQICTGVMEEMNKKFLT